MNAEYARLVPRTVTTGLDFPEGPVALRDGSVLVVEVRAGRLTRIDPDGKQRTCAETGGGPNGAAIGPDGAIYVCNNGGSRWAKRPWPYPDPGAIDLLLPISGEPGACIQRVRVDSSQVEKVYTACNGEPLKRPNDIVFDAEGGFWFTDSGGGSARLRNATGVLYAMPDGSRIEEVIHPLEMPNGIGLSPMAGRCTSWRRARGGCGPARWRGQGG